MSGSIFKAPWAYHFQKMHTSPHNTLNADQLYYLVASQIGDICHSFWSFDASLGITPTYTHFILPSSGFHACAASSMLLNCIPTTAIDGKFAWAPGRNTFAFKKGGYRLRRLWHEVCMYKYNSQ